MEEENILVFGVSYLKLTNYRCFEDFEMKFSDEHTLHIILADNMAGKSAILDALTVNLSFLTKDVSGDKTNNQLGIKPGDHRIYGPNPLANRSLSVKIITHIDLKVNTDKGVKDERLELTKYKDTFEERTKFTTHIDNYDVKSVRNFLKKYSRIIADNAKEKNAKPYMFVYIGTNYLYVKDENRSDLVVTHRIEDGNRQWFSNQSSQRFIFGWLAAKQESIDSAKGDELLEKFNGKLPRMAWEQVRKNVTALLPKVRNISWSSDSKILDMVLELENEEVRLYSMLSDGYKYLILLILELTVRACLLNQNSDEPCHEAEGTVLIDEFGVHIHPELQKDILLRLQSIFPNLQFIITTHSPMLLNGLKKEQIHILETDEGGNRTVRHPDRDVIGIGAEGILIEMFGLKSTLDEGTRENLNRFWKLQRKGNTATDEEKIERAKLYEAVGLLGYDQSTGDPLYQLFLERAEEYVKNKTGKDLDALEELDKEELIGIMDEVIKERGEENGN